MEFMRNSAMAFLSCITCLQTQDKDDFDFEGNMITKWLPPEILELVFLELNINDLCSCSKTCVRWSLVISSLYKDKCKLSIQCLKSKCSSSKNLFSIYISAKVLIATGYPFEMGQKTEIIDLLNPNYSINSKLPEVPPRYGAVGGVIQNHVIVCGGEHDFSNNFRDGVVVGLPNKIHMVEKRFDASSIGKKNFN